MRRRQPLPREGEQLAWCAGAPIKAGGYNAYSLPWAEAIVPVGATKEPKSGVARRLDQQRLAPDNVSSLALSCGQ